MVIYGAFLVNMKMNTLGLQINIFDMIKHLMHVIRIEIYVIKVCM